MSRPSIVTRTSHVPLPIGTFLYAYLNTHASFNNIPDMSRPWGLPDGEGVLRGLRGLRDRSLRRVGCDHANLGS